MYYCGLDIHKKFTCACLLDGAGEVRKNTKFLSTPEDIEKFAKSLPEDTKVALEATTNGFAFANLLESLGLEVTISNPLQTKAIAWAKVKTDEIDARTLADLLRCDYLPGVWKPDDRTLVWRQLVSYREGLTSQRTGIKNRIHALLHRNLVTAPEVSDLFGKKGREFLDGVGAQLPGTEAWLLQENLAALDRLQDALTRAGARIAEAAVDNNDVRLLMTLPGISHVTAASLVAAIGPIDRFPKPKKLGSYFRLNPSVYQSGAKTRTGAISKRGRRQARWALVEAANAAVRTPGPLQGAYLRLRRKKGHNVAVVAVARKMATIIWHLLTRQEPYQWAPPLRTEEKLRQLELAAGYPRRKSGPKKGEPSKGGRAGRDERRRTDKDLAKIAQAQYELLVKNWKEVGPSREARASQERAPATRRKKWVPIPDQKS